MKHIAATVAVILAMTSPVLAAPFELNFMPGSALEFIQNGPATDPDGHGNKDVDRLIVNVGPGAPSTTTATTSAWSAKDDSSSAKWSASQLYGWNGGLGICNQGEGLIIPSPYNDSCSSSSSNVEHPGDNSGRKDFYLIEFSKPVVITSAMLTVWDPTNYYDYDLSYWQGTGPAPDFASNTGYGFLGTEQTFFQNAKNSSGSLHTANLSGIPGGGGADWLVIGTKYDHSNDAIKLKKLSFATVPVPPVAILFGTGLAGLIGLARRKGLLNK